MLIHLQWFPACQQPDLVKFLHYGKFPKHFVLLADGIDDAQQRVRSAMNPQFITDMEKSGQVLQFLNMNERIITI